jgi:hypothetical protein
LLFSSWFPQYREFAFDSFSNGLARVFSKRSVPETKKCKTSYDVVIQSVNRWHFSIVIYAGVPFWNICVSNFLTFWHRAVNPCIVQCRCQLVSPGLLSWHWCVSKLLLVAVIWWEVVWPHSVAKVLSCPLSRATDRRRSRCRDQCGPPFIHASFCRSVFIVSAGVWSFRAFGNTDRNTCDISFLFFCSLLLLLLLHQLSQCLIRWAARHEDIRGSGGIAPPFLTPAIDWGEWSASRPCRFTPTERAPGTHWIGGWVGHRIGLDASKSKAVPVLN